MSATRMRVLVSLLALTAALPVFAQSKSKKDIPPPIEMTGENRRTDVFDLPDGDRIVQYNSPDRQDQPNAKPTPSRIRMFVPGNHKQIKAILFDLGYTYTSDDTQLQAIAREEGWVIMGCLLRYKYGTELLDMALKEAATKTGHPELVNAPIVLAGFSRNGSRAWDFAEEERNQTRTLGLILGGNPGIPSGMLSRDGKANEPRVALAQKVPALTVVGSNDPFVDYDKGEARFWHNTAYPKIRSVPDVTWGMMIGWGYGHGWEGSWTPFTVYMQDLLAMRVNGQPAADGTTPMKPIKFEDGWFAEYGWKTDWPEIAPVAKFTGDKTKAVWLPSENMAHVWRAYQVQKPKVTLTVNNGSVTAEAPADATVVEFFDRATLLGKATSSPFNLKGDMKGVQTVYAVATTPSGKTPSRPVTVVNGKALNWKMGAIDMKLAEAPERVVRISHKSRDVLGNYLTGIRNPEAPSQPAKPSAEELATVRAELEGLLKDPFVEQRDAAGKLIKLIDSPPPPAPKPQ